MMESEGQEADVVPSPSMTAAAAKAEGRRKKNKKATNIFQEFGMDSDAQAMREVEIGGIVIKRSDLSRFWQSDTDLRRWQKGLKNNITNDKLTTVERARYHEDFNADRADLSMNHSSLRRHRDWSVASASEIRFTAAQEMRELRAQLQPEDKKKSKRSLAATDFSGLLGGIKKPVPGQTDDEPVSQAAAAEALGRLLEWLSSKHGSLELAFAAIDTNGNGEVSMEEFTDACTEMGYRSDVSCLMKVLDKSNDGILNRQEFMRLKPYMPTKPPSPGSSRRESHIGADDGAGGERLAAWISSAVAAGAGQTGPVARKPRKKPFPPTPPMQKTVSFLIFRNADAHHAGEPVIVRRWPPSSMTELLQALTEGVPPMVPPGRRLYGADLRQIKSLEEVHPGSAYILKGQEMFEPPALFIRFCQSAESEAEAQAAAAAAAGGADAADFGGAQASASTPPRQSPASSPPPPSTGAPGAPGASLRGLMQTKHSLTAERSLMGAIVAARRKQDRDIGSEPAVGAPPRGAVKRQPGAKWQPAGGLGMYLSVAGQGPAPQHHHYRTWSRALPSSEPFSIPAPSTVIEDEEQPEEPEEKKQHVFLESHPRTRGIDRAMSATF